MLWIGILLLWIPVAGAQQGSDRNLGAVPSAGQGQRLEPNPAIVPGAGKGRRVALLIGNSTYRESPLRNPVNDAQDLGQRLSELGFQTIVRANASQLEMKQAIREFGSQLHGGAVGLFYFAGHGMQIRGVNYLIPVDAAIRSEADAEDQSVDLSLVLRYMEDASSSPNVLVLDACRTNPFVSAFRAVDHGLAQMYAASGTRISFATAPGSVAADGEGRNGLFTGHLLKSLQDPDSDARRVFQRTRAAVYRDSGGRQTPWEWTSLGSDFYFGPGGPVPGADAPQPPVSVAAARPDLPVPSGWTADFGTGGTLGVYYPLGSAIARIATSPESGIRLTPRVTGGAMENLRRISAGNVGIGFAPADIAHDASHGLGSFSDSVGIRTLGAIFPNRLHVVAKRELAGGGVAGLRGKVVATGAPGGATEVIALRVLDAYGLRLGDFVQQRLGLAEAADALKQGRIDAFFWLGGVPTAAISDLVSAARSRIALLDHADVVERLNRKFGGIYSRGLIPAGSYSGQTRGVENVELWNLLVADERMPDAVAYAIVKTMVERQGELIAAHREAQYFALQRQGRTVSPVAYHPGAVRYYQERGVPIR